MEENEKREFENMVSGEFRDFVNGYREIVTQINDIDVEDRTSQIEELEEDIRQNEVKIQKGNVYRQVNVRTFEEYAKEFMENIKNDQEKIEELRRFNQEVLPDNIKKKEELQNKYKVNVRKNIEARKEALISELEGQKIEFKETEELANLNKEIAEIQKQIDERMDEYNAILKSEKENLYEYVDGDKKYIRYPARDEKYKQFLVDKVNKMKKDIEPKLLQKEELSRDIMSNVKEVNGKIDEKIKIIKEQYKECVKDFTRIDNGEKDSVLLKVESAQDMNSKKAEKKVVRKVATQNRKVENAEKTKNEKNDNVEEKLEEKKEKEDKNADSEKSEKKVESKSAGTIFAGIDEYGFEVEAPKIENEDHKLQREENETEEKIFDLDENEQSLGKEEAESGKPKNSEIPNLPSSNISQAEANLRNAINAARTNAEKLNNNSTQINFEDPPENVDSFVKPDNPTDKSGENKAEQFTTDTSDLDDKFALTNDDNLKINFSVSKNGEPIIECDWGRAVKMFTLEDLDYSDTETLMRAHDVIMATIKELDDIYGTNKAEMFIDARAQSDILSKVKAVKDVAKIDIGMDLKKLYKSKPNRLLKTYRKDILEWAKKYSKEGIADVEMGFKTKAVDILKNIGDVATGIFKRDKKSFGKNSKLNALNPGDGEQIYGISERQTLRDRQDIVVENSDNRIEKMAQDKMNEKKEVEVQQELDENQQY